MTRTATISRDTKETKSRRPSLSMAPAPTNSHRRRLSRSYAGAAGTALADRYQAEAKGDLHIDGHHTTEDCGIVLGQALAQALGERRGITRYADCHLAMDDTLTRAASTFPGARSWSGT